jgi:hypothetical protein
LLEKAESGDAMVNKYTLWPFASPAYPRLTGMILDVPNLDSGFLPQFPLYRVFECLPGFHETRES